MGESDMAMEYDPDVIFRHLSVVPFRFCGLVYRSPCSKVFLPGFSRKCGEARYGGENKISSRY